MKRERQHRGTWDNNAELRFPMEAGLTVDSVRETATSFRSLSHQGTVHWG